jgi:hypothetical protein
MLLDGLSRPTPASTVNQLITATKVSTGQVPHAALMPSTVWRLAFEETLALSPRTG